MHGSQPLSPPADRARAWVVPVELERPDAWLLLDALAACSVGQEAADRAGVDLDELLGRVEFDELFGGDVPETYRGRIDRAAGLIRRLATVVTAQPSLR